ncbi:unnamed protein product, partial [Prunus brigantina]
MNGFFLQSTTTPRKAFAPWEAFGLVLDHLNVVLSLVFIGRVLESHSRLKKDLPEGLKNICMVDLIGIWDREAWWCDPHKSRQISATA